MRRKKTRVGKHARGREERRKGEEETQHGRQEGEEEKGELAKAAKKTIGV